MLACFINFVDYVNSAMLCRNRCIMYCSGEITVLPNLINMSLTCLIVYTFYEFYFDKVRSQEKVYASIKCFHFEL